MGFLDAKKFLSLEKALGKVISKKVSERARVVVQLNRFNPYLNMVRFTKCIRCMEFITYASCGPFDTFQDLNCGLHT